MLKSICLIFVFVAFIKSSFIFAQAETVSDLAINQGSLVILQYHHVSSKTPVSTSVTTEVFKQHMALLAEQFNVIALDEAISKIQNKQPLPDKSVAITFDDGYTNILENAHPILSKYKFPYTVFINPAIIGESRVQLTWEQVESMQPLATFANHTLDHAHLLEKYGNENNEQWLKRVMRDINQSETILKEKLGYSKRWLAYPYGEYNLELKQALIDNNYIGFGQQSGAISAASDFGALPRFPAAGVYASIPSLTVKLNSLAMPVIDIDPAQVEFSADEKINGFTITLQPDDVIMKRFACYFQGDKLKFQGNDNSITVKLTRTMQAGRIRVNCTAPSKQFNNRYYWFSHAMFTATHNGEYSD